MSLTAALLVTVHAVASGAVVFTVLGTIQLVATTLVLVCATRSSEIGNRGNARPTGTVPAAPVT